MLGWRDGGRTRWWQWPARVVGAALQGIHTAAALEDMDKSVYRHPLAAQTIQRAHPAPLDPTP